MNYLLVAVTFVVLAAVMAGCAVLGTDRLIPGRKAIEAASKDGVALVPAAEPPLILSDRPDAEELGQIRFATSALGYNRDEVDGVLAKVVAENSRLRQELEALRGGQSQDATPDLRGEG
ncbi:DivIVA domain-containing protein [Rothia nasimurium]|uniref:DivIVA domain-containing protein n=1 Tax=Rothia nasimurium TaxID=85336 RepID=UPI001F35407D|nr:DivIVA domain-containing protein [Rothia nasimurium]